MIVNIDSDEWYPVYYINEYDSAWGTDVEVDEETFLRWVKTLADFSDMQHEMKKFVHDAIASAKEA